MEAKYRVHIKIILKSSSTAHQGKKGHCRERLLLRDLPSSYMGWPASAKQMERWDQQRYRWKD